MALSIWWILLLLFRSVISWLWEHAKRRAIWSFSVFDPNYSSWVTLMIFFTHGWLSELNWFEHFLLSSSLLYMPHQCSLLSLFPMDGQLAFSFEVHLTLFLFWTKLRQGLLTLIFFVWSKDFKENHGCQFFSAMTGLDILIAPTWQQFVAVGEGVPNSQWGMNYFTFCAYSCHLTWLVSGSDFLPDNLPVRLQNCWIYLKNVKRKRWWPLLLGSWSSIGIINTLPLRV